MYGLDYPYYGAVPQMQARLNQLEGYQAQQLQAQQQMQQQVSPLRGRTVTCVEEVKAAQVMLDGTAAYSLPHPKAEFMRELRPYPTPAYITASPYQAITGGGGTTPTT